MLYVNGKPYVAPAQSPEEAAPVAAEPVGVPVAQPRQQELPWWKRYMEAASHPLPIALGIQAARTLGLYKPQAGAAVERAIRTVSDPAEIGRAHV